MKNKLVLLPLDERPCTYLFPKTLASLASKDIDFVTIPHDKLGNKKIPAKFENVYEFLKESCKDASYLVVAIDTLLYGGIVPSRLHYLKEEELERRLYVLKELKKDNPKLKIFAYHLIMRCPTNSSDDEEPDYYALCGAQIHLLGRFKHLKEIRPLTKEEEKQEQEVNDFIKNNNYQGYVDDYLNRRYLNTTLNIKTLSLVKDDTIDFLIVPQDDSAPYGYTAKDQDRIRKEIENLHIELNAYMYPDADAVSNTLIARAINEINNRKPGIFIRYASCNEGGIIPLYEDRNVSETIKYHILAAGGYVSYDIMNCDLVCMVNLPFEDMQEASQQDRHLLQYQINRNLIEFVEYIDYLVKKNKPVIVADIAYANGGDKELVSLLNTKGLLYKVNSYAGWNTSSNTLGTCIPHGMIESIYGTSQTHYDFLALRYLEDVGYMSIVRKKIHEEILKEGMGWKNIDGYRGNVSKRITKALNDVKYLFEDVNHSIEIIDNYQPWQRMFETALTIKLHIK